MLWHLLLLSHVLSEFLVADLNNPFFDRGPYFQAVILRRLSFKMRHCPNLFFVLI